VPELVIVVVVVWGALAWERTGMARDERKMRMRMRVERFSILIEKETLQASRGKGRTRRPAAEPGLIYRSRDRDRDEYMPW